MWGLIWVAHQDPKVMILAWQQALPDYCSTELWRMSFFAILWSIWLLRNGVVFNGKVPDFEETMDTSKYRLASWFKARWPSSPYSISDIVRFPKDIPVPMANKVSKRSSV